MPAQARMGWVKGGAEAPPPRSHPHPAHEEAPVGEDVLGQALHHPFARVHPHLSAQGEGGLAVALQEGLRGLQEGQEGLQLQEEPLQHLPAGKGAYAWRKAAPSGAQATFTPTPRRA